MNLTRYPKLVDLLAAEYVLGTLRGAARRRFQRYADRDASIRTAIDAWQRHLAPMAELAEPRMPPAAVWEAIERHLGLSAAREAARPRSGLAAPARASRGLFDNLAFWRGWAIGATALAAIAVVVAVRALLPAATVPTVPTAPTPAPTIAQKPAPSVSHVAVMNSTDARPVMLVAWDEGRSTMTLQPLGKVDVPAGRTMELWGIPASGHPVSLGLLPDSATGTVTAGQHKPENYEALAVSIEAPGGSPDHDAPSGPVVFTGKLLPVS
ncbi:anti-sigma factor [Paraburkholderia fynbosensis]|uniref:Anti-sigma K factor RskA C-terminal domain-containing protein n=1 Tax=Paraburkholderia fynbosensis TaxID=1200993 RepID=A0A6J5FQS9_9BURK|nr:anti-sigma factor [Paraburkholderia fynbosensis]CAB3785131.1 hypothetical protein LMG27177_01769 [Paraburkholderia fynbosensis]